MYKRENFQSEIKPMMGKLQDEPYQLENKQAKGDKVCANIRSCRAKSQNFLRSIYLKDKHV